MIEREDYKKYLSIDNGKGLLLKESDIFVLKQYGINYLDYSSVKDLILMVSKFIDEHYEDDIEELEDVLENLMEIYYYTQVNK